MKEKRGAEAHRTPFARGDRLGPQGQLPGGVLQPGPSLLVSDTPTVMGRVWTNPFLACTSDFLSINKEGEHPVKVP